MREGADRVLLEAVSRGDSDAWTQLVNLYSGRLLAFAVRQLGRRSAEAEDLVQETFLALVQDTIRATHIHSLEAFLFMVLRRKIIDFRRRKKAEVLTDSQWQGRFMSPAETPSHVVSQAEEMSRSQTSLADAMADYLDALKGEGNYRDLSVLELLLIKQDAGKEVAERMGLTAVQVTRVKHAALDFLRNRVHHLAPLEDFSLKTLWEENLFSCLKRSTLGAYVMSLLPPDLRDYIAFHVDIIACPYCQANLQDMKEESAKLPELKNRILATSTPFLRRTP
jgi:RNA polymerase sigma factor (sigma-70 family)